MKRHALLKIFGIALLSSAVGNAQARPEDETVRALITKFADSRNAHDGKAAAATYSEDGEYIGISGRIVRGRTALTTLWGEVPGQGQRTIQAVDFLTPSIAIVRVVAEFTDPPARLLEAFIVVKDAGQWNIRVHGAVMPAAHD